MMLRKLLALAAALLLALTLGVPAMAEFSFPENDIPEDPIETEDDSVRIVAEYHEETDRTTYTLHLKDGARFPDGTAVTAQDVLFSLYVYLDPGYTGDSSMAGLSIPGLANYRAQISAEHYADAMAVMKAIREAGPEHTWSEEDGWTEAAQTAYWSLANAYETACEEEFPVCVRHIVDACVSQLNADSPGAFGKTPEELRADEELHVAYAMVEWGYARYPERGDETTLVGVCTETVWQLDGGFAPTLDDFVNELKLAYDGDLAACWAVEAADDYEPALPDVEGEFVRALYAGAPDSVPSVEGIRLTEDGAVQIDLAGIDMRSEGELFGQPVLSLSFFGDAALWSPEAGSYGHAFGDVAAITSAAAQDDGAHSAVLWEPADGDFFTFG